MLTRLFLSAATLALLGGAPVIAQTKAKAENIPVIPHTSVPNFFKLPPELYFGEGIGIATNSKGHVFVYHRSGDTRLFEFDPNGNFVKEWGIGLYGIEFAHQVRVDSQDSVWVVDEGTNMVIKFNPAGRVVMVLGRRPEPVAGAVQTSFPPVLNEKYGFGRPTDVTWDAQGNIYVADGYGNARVAKYDRNGRWIKNWGSRGSSQGQFNIVHGIAVDAQGNVYVGDEGNERVQVFDSEGTFKTQFQNVGAPTALCITRGPRQVLYVAHTGDPDGMEDAAIYKVDLNGNVLGKFGSAGKLPKEFGLVNSIDCRNENELLVGELANWRVQKLALRASQ